jgi:hypothetical protein
MRHRAIMDRLIAGMVLAIAFLVMASVFRPDPTEAGGDGSNGESATHSASAHEGLRSLGSIEDDEFLVHLSACAEAPLYTVIDRADGLEVGTLMSADDVSLYFPDLPISEMDFTTRVQLMLADPSADEPR